MATPIPYISTSSPLPAVILVNVPFLLFRYSALSDFRPRGDQSLLLISRMSGQPSPSASKNAPPAPNVSGRYFLPARPLLCVNLIPAALVTSVNFTSPDCGTTAATPTTTANTTSANQPLERLTLSLLIPLSRRARFWRHDSASPSRQACSPLAERCHDRESAAARCCPRG